MLSRSAKRYPASTRDILHRLSFNGRNEYQGPPIYTEKAMLKMNSRGPERAEGARKKIAGRAFDRMKAVGIKLPIEQDLLHSRMVVIDEQEVLVSSADLDYTQMEKEFNSGIWTNNPDVVAEAIRYFDNLLRSPTVK